MARKFTTEEFIKRAKQVHGNTYDYLDTAYENINLKTKIICKFHGAFYQSPNAHLRGHGCIKCGIEKNSNVM